MPVGGIACGQLYLGGDGRLWYWDIFTSATTTDYGAKIWAGPHYEHPLQPKPVVEQGFAIRLKQGLQKTTRTLDRRGFKDIAFRGEYPIGRVTYREQGLPVEVSLEAFSPFIPLNVEDSSLPATVLSFQVKNTAQEPLEVSLAGWLENAVCRSGDGGLNLRRQNDVDQKAENRATISSTVVLVPGEPQPRPDIKFAEFEGSDYAGWKAQGTAFDGRPYREEERRFYTALDGYEGKGFVNTHMMRHGEDPAAADSHKGSLTSPEFTIERKFIHFRIGGGADQNTLGLRLLVDDKPVRRAAGRGAGAMRREAFDVRDLVGKKARLQIVDDAQGGWGHTTVDHIVFSDRPLLDSPSDVPGYGSMALSLLGKDQEGLFEHRPDRRFSGESYETSSLEPGFRAPTVQLDLRIQAHRSAARGLSGPDRDAQARRDCNFHLPRLVVVSQLRASDRRDGGDRGNARAQAALHPPFRQRHRGGRSCGRELRHAVEPDSPLDANLV